MSDDDTFTHDPQEYVGVIDPGWIVIGIDSRAAFDRINLPLCDQGENENGHVLVKSLDHAGVHVVFQYWLKSLTIAGIRAKREREMAAALEPAQ